LPELKRACGANRRPTPSKTQPAVFADGNQPPSAQSKEAQLSIFHHAIESHPGDVGSGGELVDGVCESFGGGRCALRAGLPPTWEWHLRHLFFKVTPNIARYFRSAIVWLGEVREFAKPN
jgi:hypothetical protein